MQQVLHVLPKILVFALFFSGTLAELLAHGLRYVFRGNLPFTAQDGGFDVFHRPSVPCRGIALQPLLYDQASIAVCVGQHTAISDVEGFKLFSPGRIGKHLADVVQALMLVTDVGQFAQMRAVKQLGDVALRDFHCLVEQRHQHDCGVFLVGPMLKSRAVHLVAALLQQVTDGVRGALAVFRVEAVEQFGEVILGEVRKFFADLPPTPPIQGGMVIIKNFVFNSSMRGRARVDARVHARAVIYILTFFAS